MKVIRGADGGRRATEREAADQRAGRRPSPGDVLDGERTIALPGGGWVCVQLWGTNLFELSPDDRAFIEELAQLLDRHTDRLVTRDQTPDTE